MKPRGLMVSIVMVVGTACSDPPAAIPLCSTGEDCPGPSSPCAVVTCGDGMCAEKLLPAGTILTEPDACPIRACGDDGEPVFTDDPCCGDAACNGVEACSTCPEDCGGCCGDGHCDAATESCECWADCSSCCGDGVCDHGEGETCASCFTDCGECAADGCGDGVCDPSESCESCTADCACLGLSDCNGSSCSTACPAWCSRCVYGTELENDCPESWDGNGVCECGCQFFDEDCPRPCPAPWAPVYCPSPSDTCCGEETVACCPSASCGCCGPDATGCDADGCCR